MDCGLWIETFSNQKSEIENLNYGESVVSTLACPCLGDQVSPAIFAIAIRQLHGSAIQLQFMGANRKTVRSGDFFLQLFNLAILEFYDFITHRADEMIMVPFVGHVVELCLTAEMLLLCKAGLAQEFKRAVNRGQADMGVFLGEQPIHLFGRHVFHFQKGREDVLTLTGQFQAVFRKVLLENLKLFGGLRHNNEFPRIWETY